MRQNPAKSPGRAPVVLTFLLAMAIPACETGSSTPPGGASPQVGADAGGGSTQPGDKTPTGSDAGGRMRWMSGKGPAGPDKVMGFLTADSKNLLDHFTLFRHGQA